MRIFIVTCLFAGFFSGALGGIDPLSSLYPYSSLLINPAYAGFHGGKSVAFSGRAQWIGLDGAPITFFNSYDQYVDKINSGFGIVQGFDKISFITTSSLGLSYSYKLTLADSIALRFGTQLKAVNLAYDYSQVVLFTPDPELPSRTINDVELDIDAGLWFNAYGFYMGISVAHITSTTFDKQYYASSLEPQLYSVFGYMFKAGNSLHIHPSARIMSGRYSNLVDINTTFIVKDLVHFGVSYRGLARNTNPLIVMTGVHLNKKFQVMTALDIPNPEWDFSASVEIVLRYSF